MNSRSSNLKFLHKLQHTNDKYYLVIGVLGLVIISLCIYLFLSSNSKRSENISLERFYEDEQTTNTIPSTTYNYAANAPTTANKDTTCKNNTDVVSVCKQFQNCCKTSTSTTNDCFCKHPFITDCNQSYQSCMTGGGDTSKCQEILNTCCNKYSSIDILTTNFQKPISASQTGNQLCTINGIPNQEQRCMELCQTNTNCKAYGIVNVNGGSLPGNCNLYSKVNYTEAKPSDNKIYIIKK